MLVKVVKGSGNNKSIDLKAPLNDSDALVPNTNNAGTQAVYNLVEPWLNTNKIVDVDSSFALVHALSPESLALSHDPASIFMSLD